MRYLKAFFLAAVVLAAFGVTAAAASAEETESPGLLFLPGTTEGSLEATSTTAKTKFTGIQNLAGEGYLFLLKANNTAALGEAHLLFTKVTLGTATCNTEGDGVGLVLIPNAEWHLALGLSEEALLLILLTLPLHITCSSGVLLVVTGSQESKVTKGFGEETTTLETTTGACTGSTPAFSEYDNATGTMSKVELKSEVGGIKAKSCEEIEGSISLTASADVEITVGGRLVAVHGGSKLLLKNKQKGEEEVKYEGRRTSGTLTVHPYKGPFSKKTPANKECGTEILANGGICLVAAECTGNANELGEIEITSSRFLVRGVIVPMKCLP